MSTPFQNRLVGTIIVAAAIIIFVPDILDGKKEAHQADFEAIPTAPAFAHVVEEKTFPQQRVTLKVDEPVSDEQAQDDSLVVESSENNQNEKNAHSTTLDKTSGVKVSTYPQEKIIDSGVKANINTQIKPPKNKSLPEKAVAAEAWVIHLGSFRHEKNVNELLAKLKRNGYTAYTKPIKTKQGTLTKVFIGPELIKSSLEKKLSALKKLTNVQGKIARFYPSK